MEIVVSVVTVDYVIVIMKTRGIEDECIVWIGGLGFKGWDCDLDCKNCDNMKEY